VSPCKAAVPASGDEAMLGVATSMPWPGAAPAAAVVLAAVLASITLAAPFTASRGFLPALRSVAVALVSSDEPRKDFEALASPDRGLAAVRDFSRPAPAAPPGDALVSAVCELRPSAAAGARRTVVLEVFLPLASAAADLALLRPGAFAAVLRALTRPSAPPPVPFVLAEPVPAPPDLVVPAAFSRTGALLTPVPVDGLATGFRAPAGVARALPAWLLLATDPPRFIVAFEARVPVAFLRTGTLLVLVPADGLLAAFRAPAAVARALPAPLFLVTDPTRSVAALEARALAVLARRPGPEATWAVALPVALLAPVLDRIGLPTAVLEPFPEDVCLAGLRVSSSPGVLTMRSPHLMEVAVAAILPMLSGRVRHPKM
jgi:hypothetical protein